MLKRRRLHMLRDYLRSRLDSLHQVTSKRKKSALDIHYIVLDDLSQDNIGDEDGEEEEEARQASGMISPNFLESVQSCI